MALEGGSLPLYKATSSLSFILNRFPTFSQRRGNLSILRIFSLFAGSVFFGILLSSETHFIGDEYNPIGWLAGA